MPRQCHLGRRDPSLQTCHHATVYEIKFVGANSSVMAHTIIPNLHASDGSLPSGGDGVEECCPRRCRPATDAARLGRGRFGTLLPPGRGQDYKPCGFVSLTVYICGHWYPRREIGTQVF